MIYKLSPVLKSYIWGGEELQKIFDFDQDRLAEAWILAANKEGSSKIIGSDKKLIDVIGEHFPLLIKLLCSSRDLSIQNHPVGKAEFWYILDCQEDSYIYWGLNKEMSKNELARAIEDSSITYYLNKVKVNKGDCFYIPPGMIHMLGKNILAVEIQQNLNVTYRLFDFNRRDSFGNLRELRVKDGVEIADLNIHKIEHPNVKEGEIISCPFFKGFVYKNEREIKVSDFVFIYIIDGNGKLNDKDVKRGDSFYIEKDLVKISGDISYLVVIK